MNDIEYMKQIDLEYRQLTGFEDSRDYKIFNTHIHPFPLLILGWNPGGKSDGSDLCASRGYFESWEHDYVCFRRDTRYAIAGPMCVLLSRCLGTRSINALRQVPVANLIFRRSQESKLLYKPEEEAKISKSGLEKIIARVSPDVILFLGIKTYDSFARSYCSELQEEPEATMRSLNGRERIYMRSTGVVDVTGKRTRLLAIAHPTGYRWPSDLWERTISTLEKDFEQAGLRPIDKTGRLVELADLPGYGHSL